LRRRFDPLARVIAAHVTLVFPFDGAITAKTLQVHLEQTLAEVSRFQIQFTDVHAVDDYLFLDVGAGRERLTALHSRLYTGPLASHLSNDRAYRPHVTLGRLADPADLAAALIEARATPIAAAASIHQVAVFRLDRNDLGDVEFTVTLDAA
jgi:2'-5' RNA ligase